MPRGKRTSIPQAAQAKARRHRFQGIIANLTRQEFAGMDAFVAVLVRSDFRVGKEIEATLRKAAREKPSVRGQHDAKTGLRTVAST